jgi:hypothetical protein
MALKPFLEVKTGIVNNGYLGACQKIAGIFCAGLSFCTALIGL